MFKLAATTALILMLAATPLATTIFQKGEWFSQKLGLEPFHYPAEPPRPNAKAIDQAAPQPVPQAAQKNPAPKSAALPPGEQSGVKKNDVWERLNDSMIGRKSEHSGGEK